MAANAPEDRMTIFMVVVTIGWMARQLNGYVAFETFMPGRSSFALEKLVSSLTYSAGQSAWPVLY
jgi:hypothetical protein